MKIPTIGSIAAYAVYVDLNGFTKMVKRAESYGNGVAQFVRDSLAGAIAAIEKENGEVIAFAGDAVVGVVPPDGAVVLACLSIARDLDRLCEWVSNAQESDPLGWAYMPGGPSMKIGVEYGALDVSTITSRFLGTHRLLIGSPINYAARIAGAGVGNRCHVGPVAASMAFATYPLDALSKKHRAKDGEYEYVIFSMGDVWREGKLSGRETYWG